MRPHPQRSPAGDRTSSRTDHTHRAGRPGELADRIEMLTGQLVGALRQAAALDVDCERDARAW